MTDVIKAASCMASSVFLVILLAGFLHAQLSKCAVKKIEKKLKQWLRTLAEACLKRDSKRAEGLSHPAQLSLQSLSICAPC